MLGPKGQKKVIQGLSRATARVLTFNGDFSFGLVGVAHTSVHATVGLGDVLQHQLVLATILDDLHLIVLLDLDVSLKPFDRSQYVVQLASQRDRVLDEQRLALEHLGELVVVIQDLQLRFGLIGLLLDLTGVAIGIFRDAVLDDQRHRSVEILTDDVPVAVLQLGLALPPGDWSQRVVDLALQDCIVREEALRRLLERLGELVHRIGFLDGQVGHALHISNLQRVLTTVLDLGVQDQTSVDIALALELILGSNEDFLENVCNWIRSLAWLEADEWKPTSLRSIHFALAFGLVKVASKKTFFSRPSLQVMSTRGFEKVSCF